MSCYNLTALSNHTCRSPSSAYAFVARMQSALHLHVLYRSASFGTRSHHYNIPTLSLTNTMSSSDIQDCVTAKHRSGHRMGYESDSLRLFHTLHYNGYCVKEVPNVEDIHTSSKRTDTSEWTSIHPNVYVSVMGDRCRQFSCTEIIISAYISQQLPTVIINAHLHSATRNRRALIEKSIERHVENATSIRLQM